MTVAWVSPPTVLVTEGAPGTTGTIEKERDTVGAAE